MKTPSTIVRKELLTAAIAGRKDVARVEIKQIDFAPSQRTGLHRHPCPISTPVRHCGFPTAPQAGRAL